MNSSKNDNKKEKIKIEDSKTTKYYIDKKDKIKNEIQELLTDQEIIKKKLIEENNEYYILEIIFPEEITQKNLKIKFLLMVNKEYPNKEPELYCITVFCHPHLCDGRNLLNNIINGEWNNTKFPLETIINKIPKFIIKYNEYKDNGNIIGNFALNKCYKINFLKSLPIYFYLIPNKNQILTISDLSLFLYNIEKNDEYCKLTSYIDIKDIAEVKSLSKKNIVSIKYKNPLNKTKKITINSTDYETITAILNEKRKVYQKKDGKLPDIDINKVESEIEEKEKEIKDNNTTINTEKSLYLMFLYQKAVEYYSAINNPKFIEITHKIHKLFKKTELNNSLDKNDKKNIDTEINKKEKEEKDKNEKQYNNSNKINEENKKEIINKKIEEKKDKKEIKDENKNVIKNEIKNNEKEEKNKNKDEKVIKENKGNEDHKNKIEVKQEIKENVQIKDEKKDTKIKNEISKEKKDNKNENKNDENKSENKENKENKNKNASLRLKIDEGELGTLDVGDEEDEEEDD